MVQKVLTKKTFIGQGTAGHLGYPGDLVDVDAKGDVIPAPSTPIGNMNPDQIEAYLKSAREFSEAAGPQFGDNVADPVETNTGAQAAPMAAVAPHAPSATQPQTLPPGTVQSGGTFIRPASEEAPAAREEIVANTAEQIDAVDTEGAVIADTTGGDKGPNTGGGPGGAGDASGDAAIEGNLAAVSERVSSMSAAELDAAEKAENDREVPRKGVLGAIAKRRDQLSEG